MQIQIQKYMFNFLYIYIGLDFQQKCIPCRYDNFKHFNAHFTNFPNKLQNSEKVTKVYAKNVLHCQQQ